MEKTFSVLFVFVLSCNVLFASPLISEKQDKALFEILNLRTKTARNILYSDKNAAFDLNREYLYNWCDVLELILLDNKNKYESYQDELEKRIKRIETQSNESDRDYHIILAEIYVQAGMLNMYYGDFLTGFGKIMKANKNARLNEKNYPGYWRNNKLGGALNVSVSSLSLFWKTLAGLFSLNGDFDKGIAQLKKYVADVKDYKGMKSEGILYYAAALKVAKDEEGAFELLRENVIKEEAPALSLFMTSNVFFHTGRNEEAISYLSYYPKEKAEIPFIHYDYLMGKEKLLRFDNDTPEYFKRFLNSTNIKNYRREICLKLAHFYLVNDDIDNYRFYLKKMDEFPKATIDRDREADIEKNKPYLPNPELLKARYLVSGSYFEQAALILKNISGEKLEQQEQKNEYLYLQACISNGMNKGNEAIAICDQLIKTQADAEDRFPVEAALLAGNICLKNGSNARAEAYFKKVADLDGNDDVYIEIIHRKAKNQLKKIGK